MINDVTIIPETSTTRQVTFRFEAKYGVYLLFWQQGEMVAGMSIQWPEFITGSRFFKPGISIFSHDAQEIIDRRNERAIVKAGDRYKVFNPWELYTFDMVYDLEGNYIGQIQDNAFEEGTIFLSADMIDGKPCVDGKPIPPLTKEKMEQADAEDKAYRDELADSLFRNVG